MVGLAAPTARFIARFALDRQSATEREVLLRGAQGPRHATVYLPPGRSDAAPCWVLLHGVTVPGWHHAALRWMAHALAAAGHVAVAPEVPGWQRLEVRPAETVAAVEDVLASLGRWPVDPGRVGVMGFSVAATWGLEVAAAEFRGRIAAVAGMGGYADMHRMVRSMVVGEHEWQGQTYRYAPDPYGRWIMGASLLPLLDTDEWGSQGEREAAAGALRDLARTAGAKGLYAGLPVYDRLIEDLRQRLPAGAHPAWDLLAAPARTPVADPAAGRTLATAMAEAGIRAEPLLDPRGRLRDLDAPVTLLHGRGDHLVPWSETLRLAQELPQGVRRNVTITRLLGHTKRAEAGRLRNPLDLGREAVRFVRFVHSMLSSLEGAR